MSDIKAKLIEQLKDLKVIKDKLIYYLVDNSDIEDCENLESFFKQFKYKYDWYMVKYNSDKPHIYNGTLNEKIKRELNKKRNKKEIFSCRCGKTKCKREFIFISRNIKNKVLTRIGSVCITRIINIDLPFIKELYFEQNYSNCIDEIREQIKTIEAQEKIINKDNIKLKLEYIKEGKTKNTIIVKTRGILTYKFLNRLIKSKLKFYTPYWKCREDIYICIDTRNFKKKHGDIKKFIKDNNDIEIKPYHNGPKTKLIFFLVV